MRVQAVGTDRLRCVPRTARRAARRARGSRLERWGSPSRRGQADAAGVRCTIRGRGSGSSRCVGAWVKSTVFSSWSRGVVWWAPGAVHRRQGGFASTGAMVGDVGGEGVERVAGQGGGSVGVAARAPTVDEVDRPAHLVDEAVVDSA